MPDRFSLRRLAADDHAALLELWLLAGLPCKPEGRDSPADFVRQLGVPQIAFLGLFEGERMVGSALATHDGRKGWVNRVAVHPDFRRLGLGRRLIAASEQWLGEQGIGIFACLIEGWNETSRELVRAAGYQPFEGVGYFTKRLRPDV
jgi:GNAT superfamily N-acetyltransferase